MLTPTSPASPHWQGSTSSAITSTPRTDERPTWRAALLTPQHSCRQTTAMSSQWAVIPLQMSTSRYSESWDPSVPLPALSHPANYVSDFNSHHPDWGYGSEDVEGAIRLMEWASLGDFNPHPWPEAARHFQINTMAERFLARSVLQSVLVTLGAHWRRYCSRDVRAFLKHNICSHDIALYNLHFLYLSICLSIWKAFMQPAVMTSLPCFNRAYSIDTFSGKQWIFTSSLVVWVKVDKDDRQTRL